MVKVLIEAHAELCPEGVTFELPPERSLCEGMLAAGVDLEHACGQVGACTTCHVIVERGADSLAPASDAEEDMLDRAWGLEARSRLACQVRGARADLTVRLPRYTINHAKEG